MELNLIMDSSARTHDAALLNAQTWELAQAKKHAEGILRSQGYSRKEAKRIAGEMYTQK